MNLKSFFCLTLVLSGGLIRCSSAPSGALDKSSEGKLFSNKQAVWLKSDEQSWPWQLVYASTEDTWNENNLFITVHRRGEVYTAAIYLKTGDNYKLLKRLTTEGLSCFLKPKLIWIAPKGESREQHREQLIQITELFYGTGCQKDEHVFTTSSKGGHDLKLDEVEFVSASETFRKNLAKGEGVWKGVNSVLNDDKLIFDFCIWKDGDANCCPTAGEVVGTYKLERKTDGGLRISMDSFKRKPVDSANYYFKEFY